MLARAGALSGEDKEDVRPLILQEAAIFHLLLVVRGRFLYGLSPELLLPMHVTGGGIPRETFAAMLADPDLPTAAARAVGRAIDALPKTAQASGAGSATLDPAALEALAWSRFRRLANRAFRRGHMTLGAVAGYVGLRRVEVANLITLSEAIRTGVPSESIRARMIPRHELEAAHV